MIKCQRLGSHCAFPLKKIGFILGGLWDGKMAKDLISSDLEGINIYFLKINGFIFLFNKIIIYFYLFACTRS